MESPCCLVRIYREGPRMASRTRVRPAPVAGTRHSGPTIPSQGGSDLGGDKRDGAGFLRTHKDPGATLF